jgi:hypothetical protein
MRSSQNSCDSTNVPLSAITGFVAHTAYSPNELASTAGPHQPNRNTLFTMLHNPVYAGAYRYVHRHLEPRRRPGRPKSGTVRVALEQCRALIQERFPAYISWNEFTENQARLMQNQWRTNAYLRLYGEWFWPPFGFFVFLPCSSRIQR